VAKTLLKTLDLFCTKLSVKLGKRRVSTTLAETATTKFITAIRGGFINFTLPVDLERHK
jgi:hypothetical protein